VKFEQVRRHALSLPEATEKPHFNYASFRVRGKIFVTAPPDQAHIHLFVPEPEREQALAMDPAFLEKLLWGGKVVGLRATLAAATPAVITRLVTCAWASKAPKSLVNADQRSGA
jgi:hypothetical protein